MKEFKFWSTDPEVLVKVRREIERTVSEIERYDGQEGIVEIIIDGAYGTDIYRIFMEACGLVENEEEFNEYYRDEEGGLWIDKILYDMDLKFDDINEELEEWVKEFDLVPAGYVMSFEWFDGNICTMLHTIS